MRRATQQVRNLLTGLGDHAADFRYLARDRAGQFTGAFGAVLADAGIKAVQIPPRPGHPVADLSRERIERRLVLGGLIREYERAA